ncbi:Ribonuclease D (Rnd) (PDB:5C0Y) (PUBMED:18821773) [Commensalibacter communis]|uniref:ribonuclease D n=1 Tax=Commensalibacter communis TaxID=2972786 RepID=UPI0022FF6403|nr:ribonuclease D [Commensalibacter communis]CAI3947996.1 Ribonuclease D (Rnd) (PDB:5C0Y) (PUBMED:18821773) [Commensalibacter communis]
MAINETSIPDYIHLYQHDLPNDLDLGSIVAIDTEAMGLKHYRDRLCLVQISSGDGQVHLVQFIPEHLGGKGFLACPNLKKLLGSSAVTKIMHFARFDVGILQHSLNIKLQSVICTKIAAKLVRTFTDKHGLAALCRDILKIELCKQQQSSDWGALTLTTEQLVYAASDVLYLHQLWTALKELLIRENRLELAQSCFSFLSTRADLDILGYEEPDIFQHRSY